MAAVVKGTAHFFGIGATLANASIQSINAQHAFELNETVENGSGVTIETRRDNRAKRLNVTMRCSAAAAFPNIGGTIAISGLEDNSFNATYEVVDKGQAYQHNTHLEQTLELVAFEGISYT